MTLHDKLKEIIDNHANLYYEALERGFSEPSIDNTVTAIIAALVERLPGGKNDIRVNDLADDWYIGRQVGWNAYREEVMKVLGGEVG